MGIMKNHRWSIAIIMLLIAFGGVAAYKWLYKPPIKVGVMYSLSGNMAISESGMVDAVLMAIAEINEKGGLLGREIVPVVRDGESSPKVFTSLAHSLIVDDEVDVVFGCWTSSCRKSVKGIFEQHNHLLYYAEQYEGMENSKNIIYLGSVPNQQVIPALEWSFNKIGKRIYLVGSDYVYPRAANEVIKYQVEQWRGDIVGESYLGLGATDFSGVVKEIEKAKPDAIFSTINGASNLAFFRSLREAGINPERIPTFSFSLSEAELSQFGRINMAGDYLVWNYQADLDSEINRDFVARFKQHYGEHRSIGSSMQIAYMSVHFWARAVEKANSSDVEKVAQMATKISLRGPSGMLFIEDHNRHTWRTMRIGRITRHQQLETIWFSKIPIAPEPFPKGRTAEEWTAYLDQLYESWGGHWEPPIMGSGQSQ